MAEQQPTFVYQSVNPHERLNDTWKRLIDEGALDRAYEAIENRPPIIEQIARVRADG